MQVRAICRSSFHQREESKAAWIWNSQEGAQEYKAVVKMKCTTERVVVCARAFAEVGGDTEDENQIFITSQPYLQKLSNSGRRREEVANSERREGL
jgi:hypothetical protein